MRMSCNGCRVLRKGCSENCSIRPCLQWIKSPESQANATVFLAKFYGRAGLMNLINAGPEHLRPAIFWSLLYEACGRIVNPISGSVGLLWSGSWQPCQAAVEAVLKGAPIIQIPSETAASMPIPPLNAYDMRHISKDFSDASPESKPAADLHRITKTRNRFKRSGTKRSPVSAEIDEIDAAESKPDRAFQRAKSHESSGSHVTEHEHGESRENESMLSGDTVEASHVSQGEPAEESEVALELTLGFEPVVRVPHPVRTAAPETRCDAWPSDDDTCHVDLGLELSAGGGLY